MIELHNGSFSARVSETGAELKSLVDLTEGREHIWNGDPSWWTGSAPVLFPIIGGLKGGTYSWEGRPYALGSHGFARSSVFEVARANHESADLVLRSSAKTREVYPFDFSLRVSFSLERAGLDIRYEVCNTGTVPLLFSLGSHPAFVVPFAGGALENYYILFEREETLERHFFTKDGLVDPERRGPGLEGSRLLSLSRDMFDDGVLIFKGPKSHELALRNSRNQRSVTVVTDGAPYLGIWAKPGGAPFVCIEPWHGIPDSAAASGNLEDKEGIQRLPPAGTFLSGYRIEIR